MQATTGPSSDSPAAGRFASGNWLGDKFDAAKNWVGDRIEDIENWAEDKIMGLVAKVAPGIATLIQEGPGGLIKNAIEPAISSWVGTVTGGVNVGQIAGQLEGTFASAFAVLQGAKAGDPKCCETLVSGINAIREIAAQNREEILRRGIGYYQVEGASHGMRWTLGLNNGRTGQLYPML